MIIQKSLWYDPADMDYRIPENVQDTEKFINNFTRAYVV